MSTPPDAFPPEPGYHWTTDKALVFPGALADLGSVAAAARAVGMSRQSVYRLRDRLGEKGLFARALEQAQAEARAKRQARCTPKVTRLSPKDDIFGLGR
ncbi:MAG: helix-turn-helix domain-containing protein [Croceibacterium sp.]